MAYLVHFGRHGCGQHFVRIALSLETKQTYLQLKWYPIENRGSGVREFMRSLKFILSAVKFETIQKANKVWGLGLFTVGAPLVYVMVGEWLHSNSYTVQCKIDAI